jgi:heme exporter protein C
MKKPILKYLLFIWLLVVFFYALTIPIKGSLSTVKKYTNAEHDIIKNEYTTNKYIPVEIDNSKLQKLREEGDIVILSYKPDTASYFIRLNKDVYNKVNTSGKFIVQAAYVEKEKTFITRSLMAVDAKLTFGYVPALGERERILFFHVPMAWVSVVAFIMALIYGIKYIRKRELIYDHKAASSAALGLLFAILATVTGAIWAKFNWGAFWNWDPRQTSIFVLILIYGAYFALRSAIESDETRAKLSSVYTILAGITVPFFMFILPRIVDSLHPDPIINTEGKINMDGIILVIFLSSLAGFTALYFWIFSLRVRIVKLKMKGEA